MKNLILLLVALVLFSCAPEDDFVPPSIEQVFTENFEREIIVDIKYVISKEVNSKNIYSLDENKFITNLNGSYFHRYGINLRLGNSETWLNDELFDLTDNRGEEIKILKNETKDSYNKKRLTIYIVLRSNTIAINGAAVSQRALITYEKLFESTAPHEIGHALGLEHKSTDDNIMSEINPHLRSEFDTNQVNVLKTTISRILE